MDEVLTIKLFAQEDEPVLFKYPALLLLLQDLTLDVNGVLALASLASVLSAIAWKPTCTVFLLDRLSCGFFESAHS